MGATTVNIILGAITGAVLGLALILTHALGSYLAEGAVAIVLILAGGVVGSLVARL